MKKVAYLREKNKLKTLPQEVQETILGILQELEIQYGKERNHKYDGGYIIVVEKKINGK